MPDLSTAVIASTAASYSLGCVNIGYYLVRAKTGEDVRDSGSGVTGATNVGRRLGRSGFVLTVLGDTAKGAIAVGIAASMSLASFGTWLCILAVVAGHVWPAQLRGRGGKGAATWLGAMVVHDPRALLIVAALGVIAWLPLRRFAVAGLIGIVGTPIGLLWLDAPQADVLGTTALAVILAYSHRANVLALTRDLRSAT